MSFYTARVKTGKAQREQMFSVVPPTSDIVSGLRDLCYATFHALQNDVQ
jgi:hypothetical protein